MALKGLMALMADLEEREVKVVFHGSGGHTVVGVIVAGNREVAMVRRDNGRITNVLLGSVMEIEEYEGSWAQERSQVLVRDFG